MTMSAFARTTTRVVGSAMLGVATIVLAKAHPDDHWSTSPKISIQADLAGDSRATPADERTEDAPVLAA